MTECECGQPVQPGADACATCFAEEVAQGLRRSSLPVVEGETNAEYQRRRRAAKRAAGVCGMCYARPADKPLETCEPCRERAKAQKNGRVARGLCYHCTRLHRTTSSLCDVHHSAKLALQRRHRGTLRHAERMTTLARSLEEG